LQQQADGLAIAQDDSESRLYRKVVLRIIPFIFICYVLNYIDRVNVSFAKLQFQGDLSLSDASYGLGVGLFYVGYILFEVPSNLLLQKIGARKTITRIMCLWGLISGLHRLHQQRWPNRKPGSPGAVRIRLATDGKSDRRRRRRRLCSGRRRMLGSGLEVLRSKSGPSARIFTEANFRERRRMLRLANSFSLLGQAIEKTGKHFTGRSFGRFRSALGAVSLI
jgi:hypothetical protein